MSFFDHLFRLGYSSDLHQQLKGLAADCSGYGGNAVYQITAIVQIALSLLVMLNYYFGLFNNPRFTHRRVWLVNVLSAAGLSGLFAYLQAVAFLPIDKHCNDLHFGVVDCALFAFTTAMYTIVICLVCSLLFKWKSVSNKKIPF